MLGRWLIFQANFGEVLFQKTVECFDEIVRRYNNYVSAQCGQPISVLLLRHLHWSVSINKSLLF